MTGRGQREGVAAEFLRDVLAGRALGVPKLEAMARTAGLLGEGQRITHAKVFKKAKKSLGIRSVRNGFGDAGEWLWRLAVSKPFAQPPLSIEDTYAEALEEVPADVRAGRIPSSWIDGVARLDHHQPLTDIPPHRWRQFLSDCNNFLTGGENWAGRAAELGWNAATLFGCHRARPLAHPGGAGLLWAINGGRLVELHRDWAVIELAANESRRVFERRRVDAGNVTLPWIERGRRPGDV
jgi:hypothetical protein